MSMSDRLARQITRSEGSNLRAAFAHLDAAAIHDAPARVVPTDRDIEDRFIRDRIESGLCWRDAGQSRFAGVIS